MEGRRAAYGVPVLIRATLVAVVLAVTSSAYAAKKETEAPALPAPDVTLRVEPVSGTRWRVAVVNRASTPLRIVADVRVLRFTIESPKPETPLKKGQKPPAPTECVLPGSMRSSDVTLTLPPQAKWVEEFDVRLHCLDRFDRLVEGATVTARLGWTAPKQGKLGAPFAVVPTSDDLASAKEIVAPPLVLDASITAAPAAPATPKTSAKGPIVASGGAARSVGSGKDIDTTILLRNVSSESHTLYPRPQLIDARVINPRGQQILCAGPPIEPAPIIDFATKLAPKGTWQSTVMLSKQCPSGTFDRPGLYQLLPLMRLPKMPQITNEVSGTIVADKPQLLRVETGVKPFYDAPAAIAKP